MVQAMSRSGTLASASWILVLSVVGWQMHVVMSLLPQKPMLSGKELHALVQVYGECSGFCHLLVALNDACHRCGAQGILNLLCCLGEVGGCNSDNKFVGDKGINVSQKVVNNIATFADTFGSTFSKGKLCTPLCQSICTNKSTRRPSASHPSQRRERHRRKT